MVDLKKYLKPINYEWKWLKCNDSGLIFRYLTTWGYNQAVNELNNNLEGIIKENKKLKRDNKELKKQLKNQKTIYEGKTKEQVLDKFKDMYIQDLMRKTKYNILTGRRE